MRKLIHVFIAASVTVLSPSISMAAVNAPPVSGEVGYLVVIEAKTKKNSDEKSICLGTIVLPDVVVPAGHCLRGRKVVKVRIPKDGAALLDLAGGQFEEIAAKSFVAHPMTNGGYDGKMYEHFTSAEADKYHDVGVILLSKPSKFAKPIKVAPSGFVVGETADYASFGFQRNEVFELGNSVGSLTFGQASKVGVSENWFKAYAGMDRLTCEGDSGSPTTVSFTQADGAVEPYFVGIQATASGKPSYPEDMERALAIWGKQENVPVCAQFLTFFNIAPHIEWIEDQLRKMDPKHPRKIPVAVD